MLIYFVKYYDRIEFDFQEFIRALKCDDNISKRICEIKIFNIFMISIFDNI